MNGKLTPKSKANKMWCFHFATCRVWSGTAADEISLFLVSDILIVPIDRFLTPYRHRNGGSIACIYNHGDALILYCRVGDVFICAIIHKLRKHNISNEQKHQHTIVC